MARAEDILKLAASYIGVKENPPYSNNVIFNTHYYGGPVNNQSLHWCAAFVWDIFRMAGASGLFYGGKKTASCGTLWAYHRGQGQAVTEFQPGDIVFFDFSGRKAKTEHVGIVEKVEGGYITTIDGNTSPTSEANGGAVMRRKRALKYVSGGYRPRYDVEQKEDDEMLTQEQFNQMMDTYLSQQAKKGPDSWSASARAWAEEKGVVSGDASGGKRYKALPTKEEIVQMLYNLSRGQ